MVADRAIRPRNLLCQAEQKQETLTQTQGVLSIGHLPALILLCNSISLHFPNSFFFNLVSLMHTQGKPELGNS